MLGNAQEWVNDWYGEVYYAASPEYDPRGPDSGEYRVLRGGAWSNGSLAVRVSDREQGNPGLGSPDYGFRCVGEVLAP